MYLLFVKNAGISRFLVFFFFNDTATTEIYTLSLHDALPIYDLHAHRLADIQHFGGMIDATPRDVRDVEQAIDAAEVTDIRSEEHTSELQSRQYLVCRLLLEKKKKPQTIIPRITTNPHYQSET